jgi:hypothetical protein
MLCWRQLCSICERTLAFENAFLLEYRAFVLRELAVRDAEGRRLALEVLERVLFADEEVAAAARALRPEQPKRIGDRLSSEETD